MSVQPSLTMSPNGDVTVYSPKRACILTVECRAGKPASKQYATQYRRNLLTHQLVTGDAYFLMVFPNALCLWAPNSPVDDEPQYYADMKPALGPYLGRSADEPEGPHREGLELAVSSWLNDLAIGLLEPDPQSEAGRMLLNSGLYSHLKGGIVETETDI